MSVYTDIQIALLALQSGLAKGEQEVAVATAIALAESRGNTTVTHKNTNGSTDYGLWQINSIHGFPTSQLLTPEGNATAAVAVKAKQGWGAWSTYKSGIYSMWMLRARAAAKAAFADPTAAGGGHGDTKLDTSIPGVSSLDSIKKFFDFVTNAHNWQRVGLFVLGGIVLIVGLFKLTGDNKISSATKGIVKTGVKLAVTKKA